MAAGMTYFPIATTTLGSATGTVSFTSISSAYTDIIAVINASTASSNYGLWYRVNNDSGTNYSQTYLTGNGTTTGSSRESNSAQGIASSDISTTRGTTIVHFMNYSNTTTYKTQLGRTNDSSLTVGTTVSLWRSTAAINRIDFAVGASFPSGQFATGSTFTLYGIASA